MHGAVAAQVAERQAQAPDPSVQRTHYMVAGMTLCLCR